MIKGYPEEYTEVGSSVKAAWSSPSNTGFLHERNPSVTHWGRIQTAIPQDLPHVEQILTEVLNSQGKPPRAKWEPGF